MRIVVVLLALLIFTTVRAQKISSVLQEVIDAEKNFAAMAKSKSTRDAFVAYMADSGVVFAQGRPVNGKQLWAKQEADSSLLAWWPVFSDIAASGDMGYNTGPYEISKDRSGAKPLGYGYFSSVWIKDKQGVWKVAIDMGMRLSALEERSPALTTSAHAPRRAKGKWKFDEAKKDFLTMDQAYDDSLNRKGISFLTASLSDEARLHHNGRLPVISKKSIEPYSDTREQYQFAQLGGDMATSGDLAYAYGTVKAVRKTDKKEVNFNYLRIWKKEDGKDWKIVLDVIGV